MLRLYARMLPHLLRAWFRRHEEERTSRVHSRVHLDQVDVFGHMNQSRYAEHFELGRADLVVRSGAWARWRGEGVHPVVARQEITYRRELKPLQRFLVDTRFVGFEGRLLHSRGTMRVGDRVHAVAEVYRIFVGPDGVLPAERVEALCSPLIVAPLKMKDWRVISAPMTPRVG